MKKILLFALASLLTVAVHAQNAASKVAQKQDNVYSVAEVLPEYPGGQIAMMQFLMENCKYPQEAQKQKLQGRVLVGFVVERDGTLSNVHAVQSVHPLLDAEAERVVKSMPKWKPGKENGKAVRVQFNVPVFFRLR